MRILHAIGLLVSLACHASAQESPKAEDWLPKGDPGNVVSFEDVCIARASSDQKSILLARPSFREAGTEERILSKTVYNTETRTRTVTGKDGKTREVSYVVQVPFVITETKMYDVRSAYASVRLSIPVEQIRAWDMVGNPIDGKDLAKRLVKQTQLLAMERPKDQKFEPIDSFYRSIFRPETIIVYLELGVNYALTAPPSPSATPQQP